MEVLLKGGPANGVTVRVRQLEPHIVIDQSSDVTPADSNVPADMLYELASATEKPVYVFKAYLTID